MDDQLEETGWGGVHDGDRKIMETVLSDSYLEFQNGNSVHHLKLLHYREPLQRARL